MKTHRNDHIMKTLQKILTPSELIQFHKMTQQAIKTGAGSVRLHCPDKRIVVIGVVAAGELMTWFCAPSHTPAEATLTEVVVMTGITALAEFYELDQKLLAAKSADLANQATRKAAQCPLH